MTPSPSILDPSETPLFLDTSVLINLIATNQAEAILAALARPIYVEAYVAKELLRDPRDGSDGQLTLRKLVHSGYLRLVAMTPTQVEHFLGLVGAPFPDDLGDGEAATIAAALGVGYIALDESKANRVVTQKHPTLRVYSSLDLFCSSKVIAALGGNVVAVAVQSAITVGRMRVPHSWRAWVNSFIVAKAVSTSALG